MYDRVSEDFENSATGRKKMLLTRKKAFTLNGIKSEGMFDYAGHGSGGEWAAIITIGILELLGAFFIIYILNEAEVASLLGSFGVAASLIIFDILFAWCHYFIGREDSIRIANKNIILSRRGSETDSVTIQNNDKIIKKYKIISIFFATLIVAVAFVKFMLAFLLIQAIGEVGWGAYLMIAAVYGICALLHIMYTGYFWATRSANITYNMDKNAFLSTYKGKDENGNVLAKNPAYIRVNNIKSSQAYKGGVSFRYHKITEKDAGGYQIVANGLLTDDEIVDMFHQLKSRGASDVELTDFFVACLDIQNQLA